MNEQLTYTKWGGGGCKGRASLSSFFLSRCFPRALRSLIIAVKSTAKQLSKGKYRQRKRESERVKVRHEWKATVKLKETGTGGESGINFERD